MPFTNTIRVRYGESDQMGVAHHGAYITWLEECRIEMMRARGTSYRQLEEQGIFMPVVELNIRYRRSLRFDDVAECTTTISERGPSRMTFSTVISGHGQVCAEARVTIAAVDGSGRPMRIPAAVATMLGD